jgi:hypothetical protein
MGKGLPRRGAPNPHLKSSFPWRTQIAMGETLESRALCGRVETGWKKLFRREKVSGPFIDQSYWSDRCEKPV